MAAYFCGEKVVYFVFSMCQPVANIASLKLAYFASESWRTMVRISSIPSHTVFNHFEKWVILINDRTEDIIEADQNQK